MARRTENFEVTPGKVPDVMKAGWGALQNYYQVVRAQKREGGKKFAELQANRDLTAEARQRREAEIREEVRKSIELAWAALRTASEKVGSEIEALVDQELNVDPLVGPEIRWSELDAAGKELAKLSIAERAATDRVASLLADGRVDGMLDRAFDRDPHGDGGPVLELYQGLAEAGDPMLLRAFEGAGLARIRMEASETTVTVLSTMVEAAREARLPDAVKELLDHRDALNESVNYTAAVHGEAATDEFLVGKSLALDLASQTIGWVVAEEEEK
jgi:hypothetical protein